MPVPHIAIRLDPGPWPDGQWQNYRPTGGEVSGHVKISSDEDLSCRSIHLQVGWRTEGRGDTDSETILENVLHTGDFAAGEKEYNFRATIPAGPISYDGHHIKIVWFVSARIDIAWKRDPKVEEHFLVTLP